MGKIAKSKARKELNDKKLGFEPSDRLSGQKRKRNQKVRKSYTHEEVYIYMSNILLYHPFFTSNHL